MGNQNRAKIKEAIKRFSYRVEWSDEDEVFIARALEMPSILAHADTAEDALKEIKMPLQMAMEAMLEEGEELPVPLSLHKFKGKFLIRTTPEMHRELTIQALESDVSLNQYILTKLGLLGIGPRSEKEGPRKVSNLLRPKTS